MTFTKQKETGVIIAHVKGLDGKRHSLSTGVTDRAKARQMAKYTGLMDIEREVKAKRFFDRATSIMAHKDHKLSAAITEYRDRMRHWAMAPNHIQNTGITLNAWMTDRELDHKKVADVTDQDVDLFINGPSPRKAAWRAVQLAMISKFFDFTVASGYRLGNPAKLVRVDYSKLSHEQKEKRERQCYTDDQVARMVEVAKKKHGENSFWHLGIIIARHSALRMIDVASLEWKSLEKPGVIISWTRKRDKRVELPIQHEDLKRALASIQKEDDVYCFPWEQSIANRPWRRSLLSRQFAVIRSVAGIEEKNFHDLRSTALTDLKANGASKEEVMRAAGHSNWKTTEGYIK